MRGLRYCTVVQKYTGADGIGDNKAVFFIVNLTVYSSLVKKAVALRLVQCARIFAQQHFF